MTAADFNALQSIIYTQKQDHLKLGAPDIQWRQQQIQQAISLLQDNADAIIAAVNEDYGYRAASLTRYADIDSVIATLRYASKHVQRWMRPEKRYVPPLQWLKGERAYVDYQPLGVVGVMAPWNGPVALLFLALAGIFAAGNRVVLKPSHQTPETAELIAQLVADYFSPTVASVVTGDLAFAQEFAQAPFDHLLYTGSSNTGAQVMAAAAQHLTPVTLEMGGASPVVLSESANLDYAVKQVIQAKMVNAGQICIAPDAIYIHESQLKTLVERMQHAAQERYPQGLETSEYPVVFSSQQEEQLKRLLQEAEQSQTEVITLLPEQSEEQGRCIPRLLINPSLDSKACQHEIFGPVMRVHTFQTFPQVCEHIQQSQTPLALYYFGKQQQEINQLMQFTVSGGITINDVMTHAFTPNLPFGGVGRSGMGRYGGLEGFRTFSNTRAIYRKKPFFCS